ncbi:MAG: 3-dehydroquinate synthase [Spirochaetes bacterium]|jgi:3-amino-4-hydroxybenzoic acid synthase|nr:3-dehydroquinate synthase [Spirochaetota bacterium]
MDNKELAFYLKDTTSSELLEKIYQCEYTHIFTEWNNRTILSIIHPPRKFRFGYILSSQSEIKEFCNTVELHTDCDYVYLKERELAQDLIESGFTPGYFLRINNQKDLNYARELSLTAASLLVDFKDPTNIPLELLIAENQKTTCRIFKLVTNSTDGMLSLQTMESGSHGVALSTSAVDEVVAMASTFDNTRNSQLELAPAEVTRIIHAGMGDRVCVDTTSELSQDEGMILGSTSSGGLMLCSETHYLPYMDLRPFRVNAGGLHMYTWGPDQKAYYLSDLHAGNTIWIVNSNGQARTVTIGRIKKERRPLLMVEAKINDSLVNVFIQDDWHVRMIGAEGKIRPSREIKVGDFLLGFTDTPGRHVGIKIDESIKEL